MNDAVWEYCGVVAVGISTHSHDLDLDDCYIDQDNTLTGRIFIGMRPQQE